MKHFTRIILIITLITMVVFADSKLPIKAKVEAQAPNILAIAHELDEGVFCGWSYGAYNTEKKHLDCTTFVSAVMDTVLSRFNISYTAEMRKDVLINHPNLDRNVVKLGPDPKDPRYAGVVYAIEKYNLGKRITDLSQVQPGDFIQYWKQRKNSTWFGHASLIESVRYDKKDGNYKAKIFGSHKSTKGIAVSKFELLLSGDDRLVYIGRIR